MSVTVSFEDWTSSRALASIGTNAGSTAIPFQNWKPFKEAFAPELVQRVVSKSSVPVRTLIDPFGGSGTTALAAQFLGVRPICIEVNPYLADLITSKVDSYDVARLISDYERMLDIANSCPDVEHLKGRLPATFIEPGKNARYIFGLEVGEYILAMVSGISQLECEKNRRLLRVLLGGVMLEVSNIRVSGKGRRYRSNWQMMTRPTVRTLVERFAKHFQSALADIINFSQRNCLDHMIINGDSRYELPPFLQWDAAVFSPPYPNSFDYTDVYNVELWMLGYLSTSGENRTLRENTLSSHVQIKRDFAKAPVGSPLLTSTLEELSGHRGDLWDSNIPDMVGAYFADLLKVIQSVKSGLTTSGLIAMVVGNSQYGETLVDVAEILADLTQGCELEVVEKDPFRSMRRSPQQGGRAELHESLLLLRRTD